MAVVMKPEPDRDQRMMTLHDSNRYMLEHKKSCDVTFKVLRKSPAAVDAPRPPSGAAPGHSFPPDVADVTTARPATSQYDVTPAESDAIEAEPVWAHMYILRARCPELAALAVPSVAEELSAVGEDVSPAESRTIFQVVLDDVTADVLTEVLRFLYYEKVQLTPTNAFGVLYAVRKYSVPLLASITVKYIHSIINVKTVCRVLEQSLAYEEESIINTCTEFISRNTESVLNHASFLRSNEAVVDTIASLDYLTISEVDLFTHSVQWARTLNTTPTRRESVAGQETRAGEIVGPELRRALGGVISNNRIRFPVMSLEDFREVVVRLNILNDSETVEVYNYLACPGRNKPDTRYIVVKRHGLVRNERQENGQGDGQLSGRASDRSMRSSGKASERSSRASTPPGMSSTVFRSVFFHW